MTRCLVGKSVPVRGRRSGLTSSSAALIPWTFGTRGLRPSITITADGARVPVLEATFDAETGSGSVTAYPVLKTHRVLTIAIKGAGGSIEVPSALNRVGGTT